MTASVPAPSEDTPTEVSTVTDPMAGPVTGTIASPEIGRLVLAILVRPDLWLTALGELRRMAPRLWWRSTPHLPLPDRRLWEFRMVTAYGRPDAAPEKADVISFLEWCRATSATASRPGGHR
jgi:hypothetical protein